MLMLCHFSVYVLICIHIYTVHTHIYVCVWFSLCLLSVVYSRTTINNPVAKRNTVFYLLLFVIVSYSVRFGSLHVIKQLTKYGEHIFIPTPPSSPHLPRSLLLLWLKYLNQVQVECVCISLLFMDMI